MLLLCLNTIMIVIICDSISTMKCTTYRLIVMKLTRIARLLLENKDSLTILQVYDFYS